MNFRGLNTKEEAAKFITVLHFRRLQKYIQAHKPSRVDNLHATYAKLLKDYFRINPLFEKITLQTEFNNNGDCSALIKRLINVT